MGRGLASSSEQVAVVARRVQRTRPKRQRFSDDAIAAALSEFAGDADLAAAKLGMNPKVLRRRARRAGVTYRLWGLPVVSDEQIVNVYEASGHSCAAVAIKLEMSEDTVRRALIRAGVERSGRQLGDGTWSAADLAELDRNYPSDGNQETVAALASSLRRSVAAVERQAFRRRLRESKNVKWQSMSEVDARRLFEDFKKSRLSVGNFCARRSLPRFAFSKTMRRYFEDEYLKAVEANWPKNTWYVRGRDFEWRCGKHMKEHGFPHVVRSTFSRGVADLTAIGREGALLVQCKRGGYMRPEEHDKLWVAAQECGATAILAGMPDGRTKRFWVLTGPIYDEVDGKRVRVAPERKRPLREISFPFTKADIAAAIDV